MKRETKQRIAYGVAFSAAVCGFCGVMSGLGGIELGTCGITEGLIRSGISLIVTCFFGGLCNEMDKRMKRERRRKRERAIADTVRLEVVTEFKTTKLIRKLVM